MERAWETATERGLWFAALLDNTQILHQWLLYGLDNMVQADGSSAPSANHTRTWATST